jgi:hypothetical protein
MYKIKADVCSSGYFMKLYKLLRQNEYEWWIRRDVEKISHGLFQGATECSWRDWEKLTETPTVDNSQSVVRIKVGPLDVILLCQSNPNPN